MIFLLWRAGDLTKTNTMKKEKRNRLIPLVVFHAELRKFDGYAAGCIVMVVLVVVNVANRRVC